MKCNFILVVSIICFIDSISGEAGSQNSEHGELSKNEDRELRGNLVSFKRFGKHVAVGLDFVLPFIKVNTQANQGLFQRTHPLITINTASIILTALLAGGGLVAAQFFRTMGWQAGVFGKEESESEHKKRSDLEADDNELMQMLRNFKLVYKNATGSRVETNFLLLYETLEETFHENNINLPICLQKALCLLVNKASRNSRIKAATNIEKIIDGLASSKWFLKTLASPIVRESFESGLTLNGKGCKQKYLQCYWKAPDETFAELITDYIKFS